VGPGRPRDAAAVWTIRDGKIVRVDFHLSQEDALKAAGIDPDRLASE
jgi:hypothetical protein